MTIGGALSFIFNLVKGLMTIELPVGELKISLWQVFVFIAIVGLFWDLFVGFGGGNKNDN